MSHETNEVGEFGVREQRNAALARIAALEGLLVCYRVGKQPSERLHRELARTRSRMEALFDDFYPKPPIDGPSDG